MRKIKIIVLLMLCVNVSVSIAQTVDLNSVDEFFKITSILKEGKEVTAEQWEDFNNSGGYKHLSQNSINIIKSSIDAAFGKNTMSERDRILSITREEMDNNIESLIKTTTLVNYLDINNNYESIKSFRENYDFVALIENAKKRLFSFLDKKIDSTIELKPVYFFFINADGVNKENGICIDLNLIYKKTDEQRADFLAHEFFHNYREKYVNGEYYKNDLAFMIDAIQDEGIADLIDKTDGYRKYFADIGELPEMIESWENLYNQAQVDLKKLQDLTIKYAKKEISKDDMVDELIEIVKYRGHPIGFFMANQIVSAGYKNEMLETFYNPHEFYSLYNKAAKKQNLFQLSTEFMDYLKDITEEYYR